MKARVQAQIEENKRFWTYLRHLEAQKHGFSLYMKSKDADFPESLLQQSNFGRAEEVAPVEVSEDAKVEGECEEEQQLEQGKTKDVEAAKESEGGEQEIEEENEKEPLMVTPTNKGKENFFVEEKFE